VSVPHMAQKAKMVEIMQAVANPERRHGPAAGSIHFGIPSTGSVLVGETMPHGSDSVQRSAKGL